MAFNNPWGKGSKSFDRWYTNKWIEGGEYYGDLGVLAPNNYDHEFKATLNNITYTLKFNDDFAQEFAISTDSVSDEEYDFYTKTDNQGRDSGWHKNSLALCGPARTALLSAGARDIKKLGDMKFGDVKVLDIIDAAMTSNGSLRMGIVGNVRVNTYPAANGRTGYNIQWNDQTDVTGFTLKRADVAKAAFFKNNLKVDTMSRWTASTDIVSALDLADQNDDWCGTTIYLRYKEFVSENTRGE